MSRDRTSRPPIRPSPQPARSSPGAGGGASTAGCSGTGAAPQGSSRHATGAGGATGSGSAGGVRGTADSGAIRDPGAAVRSGHRGAILNAPAPAPAGSYAARGRRSDDRERDCPRGDRSIGRRRADLLGDAVGLDRQPTVPPATTTAAAPAASLARPEAAGASGMPSTSRASASRSAPSGAASAAAEPERSQAAAQLPSAAHEERLDRRLGHPSAPASLGVGEAGELA